MFAFPFSDSLCRLHLPDAIPPDLLVVKQRPAQLGDPSVDGRVLVLVWAEGAIALNVGLMRIQSKLSVKTCLRFMKRIHIPEYATLCRSRALLDWNLEVYTCGGDEWYRKGAEDWGQP